MNSIKLAKFTWAYVQQENQKILTPICPVHPEVPVKLTSSANHHVVFCTAIGHLAPVGVCSESEFATEKLEAARNLPGEDPQAYVTALKKPRPPKGSAAAAVDPPEDEV